MALGVEGIWEVLLARYVGGNRGMVSFDMQEHSIRQHTKERMTLQEA